MTEEERFLDKVAPDPNSGCWLWTASGDGDGYGGFRRSDGRWQRAHRASYELFVGGIPDGLHLDHLCRVRCCVNPDHLDPVTNAENIRRGETGINQRLKTHCPQGHPYSGDNLYINTYGKRECKICNRRSRRRCKEKANA